MRAMNRTLVYKIHLWLSLPLGVIFFLLCITGAPLVFKSELREALGMPQVVGTHGGKAVALEKNQTTQKDFFSHLQQFHKSLLMGKMGKLIVTYATLATTIILISGSAVAWPKNRRQWRLRLSVERHKGWRRLWHDLHVSLGFWCLLWLLLLTLTGVCIGLHLYSREGDKAFMHLLLDLHTGRWGGLTTKILTCLASLLGATLPISGYYLYLKRIISKNKNK